VGDAGQPIVNLQRDVAFGRFVPNVAEVPRDAEFYSTVESRKILSAGAWDRRPVGFYF
jgi:hypothetical protein